MLANGNLIIVSTKYAPSVPLPVHLVDPSIFPSCTQSKKIEEVEKDIDNVNVYRYRRPNVLIYTVMLQKVVCVVDDVSAEDEGGEKGVDHPPTMS